MVISAKQKFELRKVIKELSQYRGMHTEFVTVYIPAGYDIIKVIQHLAQEKGTASNIKSTSTRKNVEAALEKMIQHLRIYKKTPPNGLCAFCGNVASAEGKSDMKVWSIEPPEPLNQRLYRCDKTFVLDSLTDMLDVKEVYGLVVLDRRDAAIALLKGKTIVPLQETHSEVPGKMRAGGQSSKRFEKNRELAAVQHYKKVAEYVKDQFLNLEKLKGVIIGGPGPTKYEFAEGNYITDQLKQKIIGIKDLSYTGSFGLQELLEKSQDILAAEEVTQEKKLMKKFFTTLAKETDKVSYGEKETMKALQMGAVDILLLSEEFEDEKIAQFEEEAEKVGSSVEIISTETREGVQLKQMGKVAAILRFPINF